MIFLDTETTTLQSGSPFHTRNKLCLVGYKINNKLVIKKIEYDLTPYGESLTEIQKAIDSCSLLVLFNAKFDLHWLRRYNISFEGKKIWDCQVGHFIQTSMTHVMPSMNEVADFWNIGQKLDVVKQMWEQGIDTPDIPEDILNEYLEQDVLLTEAIYHKQMEWFNKSPELFRLSKLQMMDILVLEEMEYNGTKADKEGLLQQCTNVQGEIDSISSYLYHHFPSPHINWGSDDHISACLYGGVLKYEEREKYIRYYKKAAPQEKEHWVTKEIVMPRLVEPNPKSKCKKEGYWKTNDKVLRSLKCKRGVRDIIDKLLQRGRLQKSIDSYYKGLPALLDEMESTDNVLHGQLNQTVAATSRLSSSNPNMQNMSEDVRKYLITRF